MAYKQRLNTSGLSRQTAYAFHQEFDAIRAELNDIRTKYAALLAKLDADAGVTDTNYASTQALSAAQFTAT